MTLVHHVFLTEYTICKLNSSGKDTLNLETQVLSGQQFWKEPSSITQPDYGYDSSDHENNEMIESKPLESISAKLIRKIVEDRRQRSHLAEDLLAVKENMKCIEKLLKNKEDRNIYKMIDHMVSYRNLTHYKFLYGLERTQENY